MQAALADPLVVPPSQYWDGVDGPWSTFWVSIGTPPQTLRLLPSTTENAIWPVLPEGCTSQDRSDCPKSRGMAFNANSSSTWSDIGLFKLGLVGESALGLSGNGRFGYDNVRFGVESDESLPLIPHQVIEGIATKDFYLGAIGLSPNAVNISSFSNYTASLLSTLRDLNTIPSLSWGYTAGTSYSDPPAFGSLTLGGYDGSRFQENGVMFPMSTDTNRELQIFIQQIRTNFSAQSLLDRGHYALIDTLIPHMWLPSKTCQAFQDVFGLSYNKSVNVYTINDTAHETLIKQNPEIAFVFNAEPPLGDRTVEITVPYASFDLTYTSPGQDAQLRYFPLKQAQNATQHRLGRAFFQNAYIIADFERANFSISQATFIGIGSKQNIIAISSPNISPGDNGAQIKTHGSQKLPKGAVGGISAAGAIFISCAILGYVWWRKSRQRITSLTKFRAALEKPSVRVVSGLHELVSPPANSYFDPENSQNRARLESELPGDEAPRYELEERTTAHDQD